MEDEYIIHKNKKIVCSNCGRIYKVKDFKIYLRSIESCTHEASDCRDSLIKNCKCGSIIELWVESTKIGRLHFKYSKDCSNFQKKYYKNGYWFEKNSSDASYSRKDNKNYISINELNYKEIMIFYEKSKMVELIYDYLYKNNIKFKAYPACFTIYTKGKKDGKKIVEDIIDMT